MSLHTKLLPTLLLMSILCASTRSGSFRNRTTMSEKEPQPTTSTPLHITNGTTTSNRTKLQSTSSILLTTRQRETQNNITSTISTTISHQYPKEPFKSSQSPLKVLGSRNSPSPPAAAQGSAVLVVSVVLAFCLSTIGVVAAVFFVRWKRIKKMKKGFQEEMAVICLHDELASEALYSSWKPFMDGNENNKVKLVIETRQSCAEPNAS